MSAEQAEGSTAAEGGAKASLRVTTNFGDAFLVGQLLVQQPPEGFEGEDKLNVDPAAYGGRANWLASLSVV